MKFLPERKKAETSKRNLGSLQILHCLFHCWALLLRLLRQKKFDLLLHTLELLFFGIRERRVILQRKLAGILITAICSSEKRRWLSTRPLHIIPPIFSALFERKKKRWSLVRQNQQSSAHNFVKDFSSIFPKFSRSSTLKKGAATEIPLEYGKTEVQTLFDPLLTVISSMELPKNFENKKLPNTLR